MLSFREARTLAVDVVANGGQREGIEETGDMMVDGRQESLTER